MVPRTMFTPQPKVDSAFVCMKKNGNPYNPKLASLLKSVFAARRKTILNALSKTLSLDKVATEKILATVGINPTCRPEQITPTEFAKICALSCEIKD